MRIVETDNFDGDYPDESFVEIGHLNNRQALYIANAINEAIGGPEAPRYWKVVEDDYELVGGFEP